MAWRSTAWRGGARLGSAWPGKARTTERETLALELAGLDPRSAAGVPPGTFGGCHGSPRLTSARKPQRSPWRLWSCWRPSSSSWGPTSPAGALGGRHGGCGAAGGPGAGGRVTGGLVGVKVYGGGHELSQPPTTPPRRYRFGPGAGVAGAGAAACRGREPQLRFRRCVEGCPAAGNRKGKGIEDRLAGLECSCAAWLVCRQANHRLGAGAGYRAGGSRGLLLLGPEAQGLPPAPTRRPGRRFEGRGIG